MVRLSAGEKKKRLIIGVCKKLFYRNGYVGTTYEDICREADIPPGTITYHFDGKAGIATAIEVEYEAQNKIYIEKMCGDLFSKTQLAVIENYHMWKRIYEDGNIRRFLREITSERIPSKSVHDVVEYYYKCVMEDQGIEGIAQNELDLIVAAQLGLSDAGEVHLRGGGALRYPILPAANRDERREDRDLHRRREGDFRPAAHRQSVLRGLSLRRPVCREAAWSERIARSWDEDDDAHGAVRIEGEPL